MVQKILSVCRTFTTFLILAKAKVLLGEDGSSDTKWQAVNHSWHKRQGKGRKGHRLSRYALWR